MTVLALCTTVQPRVEHFLENQQYYLMYVFELFYLFIFGSLFQTIEKIILQDQNVWLNQHLGSSQTPNSLDYKKVRKYYECPLGM